MSNIVINTQSGGSISFGYSNNRFYGMQYFIAIDQSTNIKNAQDSASIVISHAEIKALRDSLTIYLETLEQSGLI